MLKGAEKLAQFLYPLIHQRHCLEDIALITKRLRNSGRKIGGVSIYYPAIIE
jgi:hypothetical protein